MRNFYLVASILSLVFAFAMAFLSIVMVIVCAVRECAWYYVVSFAVLTALCLQLCKYAADLVKEAIEEIKNH